MKCVHVGGEKGHGTLQFEKTAGVSDTGWGPFERKVVLSEDIMGTTGKTGVGIAYWIQVLYLR